MHYLGFERDENEKQHKGGGGLYRSLSLSLSSETHHIIIIFFARFNLRNELAVFFWAMRWTVEDFLFPFFLLFLEGFVFLYVNNLISMYMWMPTRTISAN